MSPIDDWTLDTADPQALAAEQRLLPLVYIGNQYDRDLAFDTYFAPAAAHLPHRIAGKWPNTIRWPHLNFIGRIPYDDVTPTYRTSVATLLLAPERYARTGQFTQRIFEAVLAGCLPLAPRTLHGAEAVVPKELIVTNANDVLAKVTAATRIVGTPAHADLIGRCITKLDPFRLSRQLHTLTALLHDVPIPHPSPAGDRP